MTDEQEIGSFAYKKPLELFETSKMVKICAPMVRYSKLQFRTLVREYNCDLVYTPMIISDSFINSQKARDNEFTTNKYDRPLIVQFAANRADDLATAAQFVRNDCDGVEINCGCPQKWAIKEGIGAALINKADLVCEMVKETRKRLNYDPDFTVAVKIRIHDDITKTVDLCRQIEAAGCSYLTVHARTKDERHEPVHEDHLITIAESIRQIPVVANGDLFTLADCERICSKANIKGVMCARGLLENPALFAGYDVPPMECFDRWVKICLEYGTSFEYFHKVLSKMFHNVLPKSERRFFNTLISTTSVLDYLAENVFVEK